MPFGKPRELLHLLLRWRPGVGDTLTIVVVVFTAACAWKRRCPFQFSSDAPLAVQDDLAQSSSHAGGTLSEREALLQVLQELGRRLFNEAREVTRIARQRLETAKSEIDKPTFSQELSRECRLTERLVGTQKAVLSGFRCSESWVAKTQARLIAEGDEEVRCLIEGTRRMFQDALLGSLPVLPWMRSPPESLSKETVKELHCKIQKLMIEGAQQWFTALDSSDESFEEDLARAQQLVVELAESQVIEENRGIMGQAGELYHSALALHLMDNEFATEMRRLDEDHRRVLAALLCESTSGSQS